MKEPSVFSRVRKTPVHLRCACVRAGQVRVNGAVRVQRERVSCLARTCMDAYMLHGCAHALHGRAQVVTPPSPRHMIHLDTWEPRGVTPAPHTPTRLTHRLASHTDSPHTPTLLDTVPSEEAVCVLEFQVVRALEFQ